MKNDNATKPENTTEALGKNNDNRPHFDRIIPVTKWPEFHPWPSVPGLRWLIFHENSNGFAHCVIRKGRRVLISEQRFFEWAAGNRNAA